MSTVNSEIRFAVQAPSYITSNPSKVLASGEPIFFNNGTYVFGDGTTALNALTIYGSSAAWGSITGTLSNQTDLQNALNAKQNTITTGTTAQYFRGDLSLATFPTAVSSFTNDAGYLTSSAIGVTVQGYSASTTLLGNTTTGSGSSIVLGTQPIFTTDIKTPIVYGSTSASGTLTLGSTSNATKGNIQIGTTDLVNIGNAVTTGQRLVRIGQDTSYLDIGSYTGSTSQPAIYVNTTSPSSSNYVFTSDGASTLLNGSSSVYLRVANSDVLRVTSTSVIFSSTKISGTTNGLLTFENTSSTNTGATTNFTFNTTANTGQTASTNIPNFRVNGSTKTWAAGTITNQYWNYFTANTAAFASASTIDNSYGLYVEAATAGTNATITNNWAIGTNGDIYLNSSFGTIKFGVSGNSRIAGGANSLLMNSGLLTELRVSNINTISCAYGTTTFTQLNAGTGNQTPYVFTVPTITANTASANSPSFRINGGSKTWNAGTVSNQYWNYFTANTAVFDSASTITNSYGLFVEAATAGTNATITNNYAAGFSGNTIIERNLNSLSAYYVSNTNAGASAYSGVSFITDGVSAGTSFIGCTSSGNTYIGASRSVWYSQKQITFWTDANVPIDFAINGSVRLTLATAGALTFADQFNMAFNATTGTKIGTATSQKIGFWNATPIVQPTTSVTAATLVSNAGTTLTSTDTFDGYTLQQIVKALRNTGLLA